MIDIPSKHEPEAPSLTPAEKAVIKKMVSNNIRSMRRQVRKDMYPGMSKREIAEQLKEYYTERISTQPDGNFSIRQPYGFNVVDSEGKIVEGKGVCIEG